MKKFAYADMSMSIDIINQLQTAVPGLAIEQREGVWRWTFRSFTSDDEYPDGFESFAACIVNIVTLMNEWNEEVRDMLNGDDDYDDYPALDAAEMFPIVEVG